MRRLSIEDALALIVAVFATAVCVESGWFRNLSLMLCRDGNDELGTYVGAGLVFLAIALVRLIRRESRLRALLEQSVIREKLSHEAARRDYLTGLPNRLALMEELQRMRGKLTFCLVDLDGFKNVNDRHGHAAGDVVLKAVSNRLSRICADAGGRVGRLGGDEFGYITNMSSDESLDVLVKRIVESVSMPIELSTGTVQVGASIGSVTSMSGQVDPEGILKKADAAMYINKSRQQIE
jgi:diguanylate cyclase (GGDEF)-like protein